MPPPPSVALGALRAVLLDLDGVVYTGNRPLPGAAAFFDYLGQTGRRCQCITNNSTLSAEQYAVKLGGMGIGVGPEGVLTSSEATAVALQGTLAPGARVMAIGEEGLLRALLGHGFRLVDRDPDVVVCGLDRRLTYDRLQRACRAIRGGAPLIATNPDLSLPTEEGFLPGNGATLAYLQAATGVSPLVIGKPEATMLDVAMQRIGATHAETAIVGDGLLTDILAGQRAGVTTILVLTGVAQRADLATSPIQPDYVFADLAELQEAIRRGHER
ncbi:MAG: HAD-IIA family hydrolase [Chloroflexota bacterium]|nr:HAD-IIA family hydrolase [Chloroflexota bacterium]